MASSVFLSVFVFTLMTLILPSSNARAAFNENDIYAWPNDYTYYNQYPNVNQYSKGISRRDEHEKNSNKGLKEINLDNDTAVGMNPGGYVNDDTEPMDQSTRTKKEKDQSQTINRANRAVRGARGSMDQREKWNNFFSRIPAFVILPRHY